MGKKAFLSKNKNQLKAHLRQINQKYEISQTITQELISPENNNKTISFAAFSINGEIKSYWMGVKLREHPLKFGTATFAKSIYIQDCYRLSVSLLNALKYTGVCEIEYLKDTETNEYKLIEMNPRTWLWVELAKASGINFAKMIYNYLNHFEIEFPASYNQGIFWRNTLTDTIYSLKAILKGELGFRDWIKSFRYKKINAVFNNKDILPAIALPFLIILRIPGLNHSPKTKIQWNK
jgi:predicted ATP-grasp superfamily ATP-dependent carboligase